jgi:hypothetical protein
LDRRGVGLDLFETEIEYVKVNDLQAFLLPLLLVRRENKVTKASSMGYVDYCFGRSD